jgi:hypothetical protein
MHHRERDQARWFMTKPVETVGPLVVSTAGAQRLGGWGKTKLFNLIAAGELESFLDGGVRRITMRSILARIGRLRSPHESGSTD